MLRKRAVILALFTLFLIIGIGKSSLKPDGGATPYQFPELEGFPKMPRRNSGQVTNEGVALGRRLFYDPILSRDSSFSCSSCHRQKAAFSDGPKRFSRTIDGDRTDRNTPPLFNLAWYEDFFWDGRAKTLEDQALHPIREEEMDLGWQRAAKRLRKEPAYVERFRSAFGERKIDSNAITDAIGQFLRTLISNNSKYDKVLRGEASFSEREMKGFVLANEQDQGNCLHCHPTDGNALATTGKFSNNGLTKASKPEDYEDPGRGAVTKKRKDYGAFKIPSLRNVALTAPYMHDGRFEDLKDVLEFYSDSLRSPYNVDPKLQLSHDGVNLNEKEQKAVLAFLKTLTDSTFIKAPRFSDPFEKVDR